MCPLFSWKLQGRTTTAGGNRRRGMAEEGSEYEYESLALLPSSQYGGEGGGLSRTKDVPTSMLPSSALYRNFYALSIAFALNHGCVVTCLAYSSTMLGDEMGSVTNGCLYVSYAVVAFVAAKALVTTVGPKQSLLLGVMGYCVYVFSFLLAVLLLEEVPALSWALATVGAITGGAAGGLLWTAQGRYFARNATLYAQQTRQPLEVVNANLSALFATSFLGIETAMKLLATVFFLIFPTSAPAVVFTIYFLVASASVVVVSYLEDLDETGTGAWTYRAVSEDAGKVSRLVYFDRRLTLLLPFQIAFGFASSFVPYYVFGTVIADSSELGSTWVGLLSAVVVLMATLMALPSAWAANKFGKPVVMSLGGLCLAFAGFIFFVLSDEQLGTWTLIVPFLAVYGMGRGTWENTNKVRASSSSLLLFLPSSLPPILSPCLCSFLSWLSSHLHPSLPLSLRTGRGGGLLHRHARAIHRSLCRRQLQQRPRGRHRLLLLRRGQQAHNGWPRHGHQPGGHRVLPHRQPHPPEPADHQGGPPRQIPVLRGRCVGGVAMYFELFAVLSFLVAMLGS